MAHGRRLRGFASKKNMFLIALPMLILLCVSAYKLNTQLEEDVQLTDVQVDGASRIRSLHKSTHIEKSKPMIVPTTTSVTTAATRPKDNASNAILSLAVSETQILRKQRISEVCQQQRKLSRNSAHWTYKLNTKDKYLLCPIPKAGWSSWKRLWFYTSGVIDSYDTDVGIREDKVAHVRDLAGERSVHAVWKTGVYNYSFVFFRNPWERLVSAYINKAIEHNYSRILHTPCTWESMEPYKADLTFKEFLTCIVGGSNDEHWRPQWQLCNVCRVNFDFVGHLETVDEDAAFVISKVGVKAKYPHSFASKKYSTRNVMEKWYADIPVELLRRLLVRYKYDFELHGYSKQPPGRPDVF